MTYIGCILNLLWTRPANQNNLKPLPFPQPSRHPHLNTGRSPCALTANLAAFVCDAFRVAATILALEVIPGTTKTASAAETVAMIEAGQNHSCALLSETGVSCWGDNGSGQLGYSSLDPRPTPGAVTGLSDITSISIGIRYGCAVLSDKSAKCWGENNYGQLGNGTISDRSIPRAVTGLSDVTQISVGSIQTCAVLTDRRVKCWGGFYTDQLGVEHGNLLPVYVANLSNVTSIAVGAGYACALLSDKSVKCWGDNNSGQLGDGTYINSNVPVTVTDLSDVTSISAGYSYACAVLTDKSVKCWGSNFAGTLGYSPISLPNSAAPVSVTGLSDVVSISAGGYHSCALLSDKSAKCWGSNFYGESGDTRLSGQGPTLYAVTGLSEVTSISAGEFYTCALLSDKSAKCWGWNVYRQLGDGTVINNPLPTSVVGLKLVQAITWNQSLSGVIGDTINLTAVGGASGNPVTYIAGPSSVCTVNGSLLSLIGTGTCSVTASQASNASFYNASDLLRTLEVSKISQTITWNQSLSGVIGDTINLTAVGGASGNPVTYIAGPSSVCTVNGSLLNLIGTGTCSVTASQASNASFYNASDLLRMLEVSKISQTITWDQSLSGAVGGSITLAATGGASGTDITYAGTTGVCTVSGSTLNLIGAGSCTVTASQAGNDNYNAAADVSKTFTVAKASQTITWDQSLSGAVGGGITLAATGGASGTAITYAGTMGVCTVSGSTLNLIGAGSCTVTASQAGNDNYNAAADVPKTFTVGKGNQTISWVQTLSGSVGGNITLIATATSNLAVSFTGTAGVCTVSGSTLALVGGGLCAVTAKQAGDSNWNAAAEVQKSFTLSPGISVSPTSVTFASQPINTQSAVSVVTVTNSGTASLSVTGVTITGTDASSFTPTNGCTTVTPSGTCTVSVTFKPTTTGAKAASLSIASNAPGPPTVVSLSGTGGSAAPIISVTPASLSFGSQFINTTSASQTLTIKNIGSAAMTVTSIAVSGTNAAAFTKSGSCTSIAVNGTCSQTLTFKPTVTGPNTATLTINSNAYLSAATPVQLTGTGIVTSISQFAGTIDGPGFANGNGTAARFNGPTGIAIDSSGNLYVTESKNNLIRKITSAGAVSTLAGQTLVSGSATGSGTAAQFNGLTGIAITGSTLYVTDTENQVVRKVTTGGVSSAFAGTVGSSGSAAGTGTAARFNRPQGVAVDSGGNVFIADTDNSTIRKATSAGVVTLFAGTAGSQGGTEGTGTAARFTKPLGLGRDASNNLYVTDVSGQTVRKVTSTGAVTTLAGSNGTLGSTDSSTGASARFSAPSGAVVDSSGNIFVSDTTNGTVRKITSAGAVTTFAGTAGSQGSANGTGAGAMFHRPVGMARDASNNLFVADPVAHTIRKITTGGVVTTFAGYAAVVGANDNTGSLASFSSPSGVVADGSGNLFVSDTGNHTIRRVTPAGAVTTFAGSSGVSGSTDAAGALARFSGPTGLAIDGSGNIYVADTGNHTIRKIDTAGNVTTVAGLAGSAGSTNATGTSARFKSPAALAVTSAGTLYVADTGNYTIRKIVLSSGAVTTLAGAAGTSGTTNSSTGTLARFGLIYGLGVDTSGNIFAADFSGSTIRRIVPTGTISVSTFAGTANSRGTTNATGTSARFSSPYGLTVDGSNNIYVSDYANCLLRKITSIGVVTTPVGTAGTCKLVAANAPSTINAPLGLAKTGTTLFFAAGNGVGQVANVP
jgi:alpha-tubulin suppressor-like RCC1 family protein/sugar lactone lactonase YvrE